MFLCSSRRFEGELDVLHGVEVDVRERREERAFDEASTTSSVYQARVHGTDRN